MDRQTKKTKSTKKKNARSIPKEATIVHTGSLARMDHSKKNQQIKTIPHAWNS